MTYNQDVNQKSSEFNKIYNKIKVLKPDIETKASENKNKQSEENNKTSN